MKSNIDHMHRFIDLFICPACHVENSLIIQDNIIACDICDEKYPIEDDIPHLFFPTETVSKDEDISEMVKAFYEEHPFPNYEDNETVADLITKSKKGVFSNMLNKQVPHNIKILEVGCGTGQLSNFLGLTSRHVFGTDICHNSLKLAKEFKDKNDLDRIGFYQMNLFQPIFKEESFHFVICNGVLHHTKNPFGGFETISRLVKKGGYILIGLYNKYGRLITDLRRVIFRLGRNHFQFIDPRLRDLGGKDNKKNAWFKDQYNHPHESKHTIGEVLKWFHKTGFNFVTGIPPVTISEKFNPQKSIFNQVRKGTLVDHLLAQLNILCHGSKEGGLFVMIGKRM